MKANSYRIGNYIQRNDLGDGHKRVEQILELGELTCTTTGPVKVICGYLDISGIPISEEWLIEAGFEEVLSSHPAPNHRAFEIGCIHVKLYNHGELKVAVWVNEVPLLPHRHWYLHNIQNLHHSLSGEELEFKL